METIAQIIKQLPPIWPRLAAIGVLVLLLALPQAKKLRKLAGSKDLDRAKKLLEVRKLQFDVDKLRAANADLPASILDRRIERVLADTAEDEADAPPLLWPERLRFAGLGGLALALLGLLAAFVSDRWEGRELFTGLLKELLVIIPCAFVASAIPARNRWLAVFYGFLIPILVVAVAVTARIKD